MSTPGLVSAIVPVYNRPELLREAVASVLAQTYRPLEVIVVDDGSTDSTPAVAAELQRAAPERVRVLRTPNGGVGAAREAGRQAACGEFIQYLDSDDRLLPDKFAVQVKALREEPDCGAAYGITRLIDERGAVLVSPYKWTGETRARLFPGLLVDRWWCTHTPLWRSSVCDAIGPWRNWRMAEDWEYEARAAGMAIRLVHCPVPVSDTRRHTAARLTGAPTTPGLTRTLAELIVELDRQATRAGLAGPGPELRHFARWAFAIARQAGAANLDDAAPACLAIAVRRAQDAGLPVRDMHLYALLASIIGWRGIGRVSRCFDRARPHKAGAHTLPPARQTP